MWKDFQTLPVDADGVGSKKEVVVYWPPYFPDGSRLTVHTVASIPDLLTLANPPTKWDGLDPVVEDTQPPTSDDKAAALVKLIAQIEDSGGDASVLVAIAADAKIVLPDPKLDASPALVDPAPISEPPQQAPLR